MLLKAIIAHLLGVEMRKQSWSWSILAGHANGKILVTLLELKEQDFEEIESMAVSGRHWILAVRALLKKQGVDVEALEHEPKELPVFWVNKLTITRISSDTFTFIKKTDWVGG